MCFERVAQGLLLLNTRGASAGITDVIGVGADYVRAKVINDPLAVGSAFDCVVQTATVDLVKSSGGVSA